MDFSLTNQNSEILIRKIGLTLLHSLWLGILLAIGAGLVLLFTKKAKPELRYNLLTGLLCLFVIAIGFTFFLVDSNPGSTRAIDQQPTGNPVVREVFSSAPTFSQSNAVTAVSDFLTRNAETLTIIWLLMIAIKSMRLSIGIYRLEYLKTNQVYQIGDDWEKKVAHYANQMGILKSVTVMQSGLVKIPMVLGHFKPVILVPLGVISSIPSDQIEMVLLHELAHIRRLDFFVNFLQHLTELLFFFNPGVLWISSLIRKERENCCDDMALRYSGNKVVYINALLSFREYQMANPVYSVAFNSESSLVQRARRIASRSNATLKLSEKLILAASVLMLFTFTVLFANSGVSAGTKLVLKPSIHKVRQEVPAPALGKAAQKARQTPVNEYVMKVSPDFKTDSLAQKKYPLQELEWLIGPMQPDTLKPLKLQHQQPLQLNPTTLTLHNSLSLAKDYAEYGGTSQTYDSLAKKYDVGKRLSFEPARQQFKPFKLEKNERFAAFNERILSEIEKNGIKISRNNVAFHITNNELTVNGVKVSDEIHRKVLSAVIGPDDHIDFTYGSSHK
jgi:bla regulator protein BlaR1